MLDDDAKRLVEAQRLGYVATVGADGTPNLSPKGTLAVWDDEHLVFADIHSPGTVANVEAGRTAVEVNVVDPLARRGYRFAGAASVHRSGPEYDAGCDLYRRRSGRTSGIVAIVLIRVDRVAELRSPAYDDGTDEATIVERSLGWYGLTKAGDRGPGRADPLR